MLQWCRGEVVGVKKNNKVHIQWASEVLRVGEQEVTEEHFMASKWNKHVEGHGDFILIDLMFVLSI